MEIPYGYCHCGCGQKTKIADKNHTRSGHVKGEPLRYVFNHHPHPKGVADFWPKVEIRSGNDCWHWKGARNTDGYGNLRRNKKSCKAHRIAWEITNGPVPNGFYVLHKCDNPLCCNPNHLFLGTQKENVDDMTAKGRGWWQKTGAAE